MSNYLGILGFSWKEKLYKAMNNALPSTYKGQVNVEMVDYFYDYYITNGKTALTANTLSNLTGKNLYITTAFLVNLKELALNGNIPYKIYDPDFSQKAAVEEGKYSKNIFASIVSDKLTNKVLIGLSLVTISIFLFKKGK
jgi:hypothetical protein